MKTVKIQNIKNKEINIKSNFYNHLDFETRQSLLGFFDLLLKIAIREKIDIGQFNDNQNINNQESND